MTRLAVALAATLMVTACGSAAGSDGTTLTLGYFPNITHATALVGIEKGIFQRSLGGVKLETRAFNAGPVAIEALFSGALDAAYVGPNPVVNAHARSHGTAIRIVSGAASGGAALVVRPGIGSAQDLRGKRIASPQLGNTQDIALRHWLKQHGLVTTKEGGGDVTIVPQQNGLTIASFAAGAIDGAWVPEPFVSRLVSAGGKVLVDERDLWPGRKFVTTHLVVRAGFLDRYPLVVKRLIEGQVAANEFVNTKPRESQRAISEHIGGLSGKPLDLELIEQSWPALLFLNDPVASSLRAGADHAIDAGLLAPVDLAGIYDLSLLNEVLQAEGEREVTGL